MTQTCWHVTNLLDTPIFPPLLQTLHNFFFIFHRCISWILKFGMPSFPQYSVVFTARLDVLERLLLCHFTVITCYAYFLSKVYCPQIRTLGMLRSRFEQLPIAFNECLIPREKNEKTKKGLKATLSRRFSKVKHYYYSN